MISVKTGTFMERTNNVLKDFLGLQTKLKIHDGKMLQWVYRIGLAGWVVSEFKRLCLMMDISFSLIIDAHADCFKSDQGTQSSGPPCTEHFLGGQMHRLWECCLSFL